MKNEYQFVAVLDFNSKHISIHFPDLEEALSQADNTEQALKRSEDVLRLTIESRLDDKEVIPEPTPINEIDILKGQRTIIVTCLIKEKIKYDKKTLTIPHDLNIAAEAMGLNFSQVLQNALREKIADKENA